MRTFVGVLCSVDAQERAAGAGSGRPVAQTLARQQRRAHGLDAEQTAVALACQHRLRRLHELRRHRRTAAR
ncbi:MAG: hypothetical protein ACK5V2_18325 [Pseudomonadota bacterium]